MQKTDVVRYFGSQTKVADFLGIKPSAVSQWGDTIPEHRAARIANLTKGREKNGVRLKYQPADYEAERVA